MAHGWTSLELDSEAARVELVNQLRRRGSGGSSPTELARNGTRSRILDCTAGHRIARSQSIGQVAKLQRIDSAIGSNNLIRGSSASAKFLTHLP